MARADRAHARRRGRSGRWPPTPRRSQVLRDPATYSSERGGEPAPRRHAAAGPRGRGRRPQHDGRPPPRADPPAREHRAHAAHGRAARGRAPPADPRRCSTPSTTARRSTSSSDGRGRAADAGDLHPARRAARRTATSSSRRSTPASTSARATPVEHAAETRRPPGAHARVRRARSSPRSGRDPTDDMLSVVVHAALADVDPPQLTDVELYAFFSLLFAAGSETTRNAIAGGPARAARATRTSSTALRADPALLPAAIEEMLRWTTPSPSKRRTATRTGVARRPRHRRRATRCSFWEGSANRDERGLRAAGRVRHPPRPEPPPRASVTASTTASAPTSPGSRCGWCSRSCSRASRRFELDCAGRVDPQQPPHRHPPPARRVHLDLNPATRTKVGPR